MVTDMLGRVGIRWAKWEPWDEVGMITGLFAPPLGNPPVNPSAFLIALHKAALCSVALGDWLPLATCFA